MGDGGESCPEEAEAMSRGQVYWFFRRKIKIIVLTAITYAALC